MISKLSKKLGVPEKKQRADRANGELLDHKKIQVGDFISFEGHHTVPDGDLIRSVIQLFPIDGLVVNIDALLVTVFADNKFHTIDCSQDDVTWQIMSSNYER